MNNQELPNTGSSNPEYAGLWGPAVTIGFAAAAVMWVLAWLLHMPGVHVATPIAIPVLLAPLLVIGIIRLPDVAQPKRLMAGVMAGLIAGLVNLLILGSDIVVQPETTAEMSEHANTLAPEAAVKILGTIAISVIVTMIAALIVRKKQTPPASAVVWRRRFAWVTALTYLPLIAVGGAVTSTNSGLAVPDAVTSYGAISVLFPLRLMAEPHIFFEHSHRLFGTLAGITTIVLMVRVLIGERRALPMVLSIILLMAVSLQGVMGIIRVADQSTAFAVIHGIFAQLVLALALVTAVVLSPSWVKADPDEAVLAPARKASGFMLITVIALVLQLVLGAVTRHLNSGHAMMAHMGFAFIVVMLVLVGGALCIRAGKAGPDGKTGTPIRPLGALLHGLVVLQFALGFAVLGMAWEGDKAPALPTADQLAHAPAIEPVPALLTTIHHINGALLLATAACAMVWAMRLASKRKIR